MFTAPNKTQHNYPLYGGEDSPTQFHVQIVIVLLAVITIPWMLLTKPAVLYCRHKRHSRVSEEA